jgi:peptide/nickel transport system permease protein
MSCDNNQFFIGKSRPKDVYVRVLKTLKNNPPFFVAIVVIAASIFLSIFGSSIAPHDPMSSDLQCRLNGPSLRYPMGNDALGRCLLSRILVGARTTLGLGVAVVGLSCLLGVSMGLVSGYLGGIVDEFFMRTTDVFLSFPEIVAAMAVAGFVDPGGFSVLCALSLTSWMRYARVVRGITLSVKERDYIKAAELFSVSRASIIIRHILPPSMPSIIILTSLGLAKAILAVSALGFLGFGVQSPDTEWGLLLMTGKDYILSAPHLCLYPGIAIMTTVLAFNVAGDGLTRLWNPGGPIFLHEDAR